MDKIDSEDLSTCRILNMTIRACDKNDAALRRLDDKEIFKQVADIIFNQYDATFRKLADK